MRIPAMLCGVEQKLRLREGKSLVPGQGASRPRPHTCPSPCCSPLHDEGAQGGLSPIFPCPYWSLKERPLNGGIQNPWYPSSINFSSSWLLNPAVSAQHQDSVRGHSWTVELGGDLEGCCLGKEGRAPQRKLCRPLLGNVSSMLGKLAAITM